MIPREIPEKLNKGDPINALIIEIYSVNRGSLLMTEWTEIPIDRTVE